MRLDASLSVGSGSKVSVALKITNWIAEGRVARVRSKIRFGWRVWNWPREELMLKPVDRSRGLSSTRMLGVGRPVAESTTAIETVRRWVRSVVREQRRRTHDSASRTRQSALRSHP